MRVMPPFRKAVKRSIDQPHFATFVTRGAELILAVLISDITREYNNARHWRFPLAVSGYSWRRESATLTDSERPRRSRYTDGTVKEPRVS